MLRQSCMKTTGIAPKQEKAGAKLDFPLYPANIVSPPPFGKILTNATAMLRLPM